MIEQKINTFCPANQQEWRLWLEKNHITEDFVWVIFYKKNANKPTITWSQAVDQALCFGWIDSTKKTINSEKYIQYFCKRKPKVIGLKLTRTKLKC